MNPFPLLGIGLHAVGGLAAGSFYLPFRRVRKWAWESYWFVGGLFSWVITPLVMAFLTVEDLPGCLAASPARDLLWSYLFGVLWGVGGLTFGLSMRYLGLSLGYALALGFCAAFGTLIPPLFRGEFPGLVETVSGNTMLAGVLVCLLGIAVCTRAGVRKERELGEEVKRKAVAEFNFARGLWVAIFAGVMSACMAFGIAAGESIAEAALGTGTADIFKNNAVLVVVLAGGFTTNALWCLYLNVKNRTLRDYVDGGGASLAGNYLFSSLAGVTWYLQFFFYGMGTTRMGEYDFSSWTLHMSFIIIFSNVWGLSLREWRGTSRRTVQWIVAGLVVLLLSTVIIGWANALAARQ